MDILLCIHIYITSSGKMNGASGEFDVQFAKCQFNPPNLYTDLPLYFDVCAKKCGSHMWVFYF